MFDRLRISRRTALRGLGTAVALPWLEAMVPTISAAAPNARPTDTKPPVRAAFLCVPNGKNMSQWTPPGEGDFEVTPILQPVAKFKSQMTLLTGLTLDGARSHGDGGGDHARSCAAFLTGAHPKKTAGADITNGVSVDQVAANILGEQTRFPSLELGIEPSAQSGNCDSGYSCAYSSNMSWRTPTSPVAKEINPQAVFDRLFGEGSPEQQRQAKGRRAIYKQSILDFALEDAKQLQDRLGASDRRKLDEYLFAVRDIEKRLNSVEKLPSPRVDVGNFPRPAGTPKDIGEHVRLMFDMLALAFQTDSTRVISFLYVNEGSNRSYKEIGVAEGHHDLSHHGGDKGKHAKIAQINTYHVTQLAHLLERLSTIREGNGSLLDNCMVLYGSGISDGDQHNHDNLPIALFGRAGRAIQPGRHLRYPRETPLTNLYLTMLDHLGAKVDTFGDATGRLEV